MDNRYFMKIAMEQARLSSRAADLRPPYVGAIVVKDSRIVGKGYKGFSPDPSIMVLHAERDAIDNAGENSRGATLYTTLQPCTPRYYKTVSGPCSELIVQSGIQRVVIGLNPDRRLGTKGIKFMREKGIEVVLFGDLQNELDKLRYGL